jgi:hypothetical protein
LEDEDEAEGAAAPADAAAVAATAAEATAVAAAVAAAAPVPPVPPAILHAKQACKNLFALILFAPPTPPVYLSNMARSFGCWKRSRGCTGVLDSPANGGWLPAPPWEANSSSGQSSM